MVGVLKVKVNLRIFIIIQEIKEVDNSRYVPKSTSVSPADTTKTKTDSNTHAITTTPKPEVYKHEGILFILCKFKFKVKSPILFLIPFVLLPVIFIVLFLIF